MAVQVHVAVFNGERCADGTSRLCLTDWAEHRHLGFRVLYQLQAATNTDILGQTVGGENNQKADSQGNCREHIET